MLSKRHLPDRGLLLLMGTVFAITFLSPHNAAGGWFWDLANGLGFASLAGLLYLCLLAPKNYTLLYHQQVSYAVVSLLVAHGVWMLVGDPITLEYLIPPAPLPMLSGVLALLCLLLLVASSLSPIRSFAYQHHNAFKYWHRLLSWLAVAASLYHIVGSGFYLPELWQPMLLCALALAVLWPGLPAASKLINPGSAVRLPALAIVATLLFAALRNLLP